MVNSSHVAVRIPRGTVCGTYELIDDDTLHKIRPISPQYVQQIAEVEERKRPAPPTVRPADRAFIDAQAVLNVPLEWKEKYQNLLYEFHDVFSRALENWGAPVLHSSVP